MAKRTVQSNTFEKLPEGEQILCVTNIEEDTNFNTLTVTYSHKSGVSHNETYRFEKADGTPNNVALSIYTAIAGKILGLKSGEEFDDNELLGMFFKANVEWIEGKPYISSRTGKEVTPKNLKLTVLGQASGFDDTDNDLLAGLEF